MAHESVFAKALPKVGHANKDTQNGEMESEGVEDDVPSADLEEGEIVDSGQEDSDDQRTGPPGPLLKGPPLPSQEALRPAFTKLDKRKRKKRKKDEAGSSEQKQKRAHYVDHDRMVDDSVWFSPESGGGPSRGHHSHHGSSMPPRDFGSPGPYDDSYMPMALLHDQLEFERLCASRGVLEEMLNDGLLMRIHPCDMSPRGGCDSPDGSGGPEGHQEGMGGPPTTSCWWLSKRSRRTWSWKVIHDGQSKTGAPQRRRKRKSWQYQVAEAVALEGNVVTGHRSAPYASSTSTPSVLRGQTAHFRMTCRSHARPDLCKFYLGGYCAHTACRFSHQPLTDDMRRLLHRYLDNHGNRGDDDIPPGPGPNGPEPMDRPDCLDDDMGPVDDYGGGGPPPPGKRPSLLGSPPRHVKEAAETWRMQFLGGGGPPMRGGPNAPSSFGPPQGPPMMSPPRGPVQGFPHRPLFYVDSLSQSPVRGSMPPPGTSPPQMGGPSPVHCIEDSFGGPPGPMGPGGPMRLLPQGKISGFASPSIASPPQQDQGSSGHGFVPDGAMSPRGIFYDSSQDHPMSPPHQPSPHHTGPQSIPGLNLLSSPSPPHSQAMATDKTESPVVAKPEPKNIVCLGNSESSDDDEDYDDDQPLRAVLKKLQQGTVESTVPANIPSTGSTSTPSTVPQPAVTLPSLAGIDFASMLSNIQQVPSQSQSDFWKQLFSGVPVPTATAAATSLADTSTPVSFSSLPAASRDPRRARADSQIAKPSTEQLSRDPRLRDKPPPVVKAAEVAFVESKDGDVPFRLTPIFRALPKYDDIALSGTIPESKLKHDPRLAKYMSQKALQVVPSAEVVQPLPLPAVLPQLPNHQARSKNGPSP
ncbi:hypothetical protein MRX96_009290 [Rhipicephalus microplus]